MPHQRNRLLLKPLLKSLKTWPVVGLLGARQTGKSVLLRELLSDTVRYKYRTLDKNSDRTLAEASPDSFAEEILQSRKTLVIDEAQKVPTLFDSVKAVVDGHRRPGMFVLSGSSEFSEKTGIRESMTGRIGLLHLFPMTIAETCTVDSGTYWGNETSRAIAKVDLDQFERALERGGMPGMCFLRNEYEWRSAIQLWTETTCFRDLARLKSMKKDFDGDLAFAILAALAQCDEPTALQVSRKVKRDRRVVQRYLDGFCVILVLRRLTPHGAGVGDNHYLLLDPGISSYLEASREVQLRSHVLKEALAHLVAAGFPLPRLEYYRNARTSRVPIVLTWPRSKGAPKNLAIQIADSESYPKSEIAALRAFHQRLDPGERGAFRLLVLNSASTSEKSNGIELRPLRG